MVAPARTRHVMCTIVRVAERPLDVSDRLAAHRRAMRPSAMVPWADPYIANLVRGLQDEVRRERTEALHPATAAGRATDLGELEPPNPSIDPDWDWWDRPSWTTEGEPTD